MIQRNSIDNESDLMNEILSIERAIASNVLIKPSNHRTLSWLSKTFEERNVNVPVQSSNQKSLPTTLQNKAL